MSRNRIVCIALLLFVSACAIQNGCGLYGTDQTGSLRVLVTDKPYPFELIEEATITITEIQVRRAADDDDMEAEMDESGEESDDEAEDAQEADEQSESEADGEDEDGAWLTIMSEARTVDLLDLRNGRMDLLAQATVAADDYTEMRLIVTEGMLKLISGEVFPLKVPSGEQTGIKLKLHFSVAPEEETVLLLDVDLSRAFLAIPSGHIDDPSTIRGFHFSPAIAMRLINLLEAGRIEGTVTDDAAMPLENVAVTAFDDNGEEVTSTATDADGTYALVGLPTGTYRVEFSMSGFEDSTVTDVEVTAGATTAGVDAQLTAVSG